MPGPVNPDGTVQVSPPLQSAFAPQPGQQPAPPPQAGVPQVQSAGADPGFAGAIMALISHLAGALAPKSITQAQGRTKAQIDAAENGEDPNSLVSQLSQK